MPHPQMLFTRGPLGLPSHPVWQWRFGTRDCGSNRVLLVKPGLLVGRGLPAKPGLAGQTGFAGQAGLHAKPGLADQTRLRAKSGPARHTGFAGTKNQVDRGFLLGPLSTMVLPPFFCPRGS